MEKNFKNVEQLLFNIKTDTNRKTGTILLFKTLEKGDT